MEGVTYTGMQAVLLILVLVFPLSALLARRVPVRTALMYGGIWLVIAAALAIVIRLFT